jgi:hypothetical protein
LDVFTRWLIAIPIPNKKALTVATAIFNNVICKFGAPVKILTDQGSEFVNAGLKAMCRRWNIHKTTTTGWQPQANPVERYHRWLNAGITAMHAHFGPSWDTYVDAVVFTYNVSENEATGYSPFEMVHGRKALQPSDAAFNIFQEETDPETPTSEKHFKDIAARLRNAYIIARRAQARMAKTNREARPLHTPIEYASGDKVLYWQPRRHPYAPKPQDRDDDQEGESAIRMSENATPGKWLPKWTGPHDITKRIDANLYRFTHATTGRPTTSHVNRLTKFVPWSDAEPSTSANMDKPKPYKMGGEILTGSMMAVELDNDAEEPFGVAKVTAVHKERGEYGEIDFVWYSNPRSNPRGRLHPGWISYSRGAVTGCYFAEKRRSSRDIPYTGKHSHTVMTHWEVIVHGFELAPNGSIPRTVLNAIEASGRANDV